MSLGGTLSFFAIDMQANKRYSDRSTSARKKCVVRVVIFDNSTGSKQQMAISLIRPRNKGEKELRPFGDRSVEYVFSFVCNKTATPGWAM